MPRYTVAVNIYDPPQGMAWEDNASDEADAEVQAITYFEDGGDGPLAGLTRDTGSGGDYSAVAQANAGRGPNTAQTDPPS